MPDTELTLPAATLWTSLCLPNSIRWCRLTALTCGSAEKTTGAEAAALISASAFHPACLGCSVHVAPIPAQIHLAHQKQESQRLQHSAGPPFLCISSLSDISTVKLTPSLPRSAAVDAAGTTGSAAAAPAPASACTSPSSACCVLPLPAGNGGLGSGTRSIAGRYSCQTSSSGRQSPACCSVAASGGSSEA